MGGSASLQIHDGERSKGELLLKEIMADQAALAKLFRDLATCKGTNGKGHGDHRAISLKNMIDFLEAGGGHEAHAIFDTNRLVLVEAHKYAADSKTTQNLDALTPKGFKLFLSSVYYFSHLYKLYAAMDSDITDNRIFMDSEFARLNDVLHSKIDGIKIEMKSPVDKLSREQLIESFRLIDKDANGYITFREFVNYACQNMMRPEAFASEELDHLWVGHEPGDPLQPGEEDELDPEQIAAAAELEEVYYGHLTAELRATQQRLAERRPRSAETERKLDEQLAVVVAEELVKQQQQELQSEITDKLYSHRDLAVLDDPAVAATEAAVVVVAAAVDVTESEAAAAVAAATAAVAAASEEEEEKMLRK